MRSGSEAWFIDGNNVMGSRPDGWWNDREAAMARLTQSVATWCNGHAMPVTLVFDGTDHPSVTQLSGGNLTVRFSPYHGRNGADRLLVELLEQWSDPEGLEQSAVANSVIVTADNGLKQRVPDLTRIESPRRFLERIARPGG